ncbi:ADP-ribosylglycohydrolase family protein [Candidatus Uabimicrobium sp. HlEnr_7]|uniref:ADP-ribosylglycohydrolase family protein n=1 Tax=Candidatus Uabimicrobium helgolandensis TaxID=3095367 RepID=UPI003555DCDF
MNDLLSKFTGAIFGAVVGDVIGAAVEAHSSEYINSKYKTIDDILEEDIICDSFGKWQFGCFTDDTQTIIAVSHWLINGRLDGESLLDEFVRYYEEWRRYGPSMEKIICHVRKTHNKTSLSQMCFAEGSYGNNSVVRILPVALRFCNDYQKLIQIARISSLTTHSHRLAVQAAILNAVAIMFVINMKGKFHYSRVTNPIKVTLNKFKSYFQDTREYEVAIEEIENGLEKNRSTQDMLQILGSDITAQRSFPIALYSFLKNPNSYEKVIADAIFIGGDTDSVACMAGALSGAYLGIGRVSQQNCIKESVYNKTFFTDLAKNLYNLTLHSSK